MKNISKVAVVARRHPDENKICMRRLRLLATKIDLSVIGVYVKYMIYMFWRKYLTFVKKINLKCILPIRLLAKIYLFHTF